MAEAPADLPALLDFAVELAEAAGPIALRYFRAPLDVHNKLAGGGFDPVTRADREVEAFIRDAIDGTRSFISGSPAWGTLVGIMHDQRPLAGVVHVPYLRESFCGGPSGAWMQRDGQRTGLRCRPCGALGEAILYCTHPATFTDDADRRAFARVAARCRLLRYGGDCYSYCMLALGQVDLIIEGSLQPYDIIPIIPIVTAAGGVISNARGETAQHGGVIVAAANAALHQQALALMQA